MALVRPSASVESRSHDCVGGLFVARVDLEHALSQRERCLELSEDDQVPEQQRSHLGACDRSRQRRRELRDLVLALDVAQVEYAVESERRHAGDRSHLEGESPGKVDVAEPDAEIRFEARAMHTADRHVLGLGPGTEAIVLQCLEQSARAQREAAIPDGIASLAIGPRGAEIVAAEEFVGPRFRMHDVPVPLHDQDVGGGDVRIQFLQHDPGVRVVRFDGTGGDHVDVRRHVDLRRDRIGEEDRPRELDVAAAARQRPQRQRVVPGVHAAQRHVGELEHRIVPRRQLAYPRGLAACQRHASAHIAARSRCAFHPR